MDFHENDQTNLSKGPLIKKEEKRTRRGLFIKEAIMRQI